MKDRGSIVVSTSGSVSSVPHGILEATEWVFARRRGDPLDERFIHVVHGRMFNQTWKWAGKSRRTDKNIGVSWFEIPVRLRQMLGDVRAQIEHQAYSPVEIAARYHHRLVAIHVFPNGNGRHARLMADLLLTELAGQRFEWGRGSLVRIPVDRDRAFRFNVTEDSEFA